MADATGNDNKSPSMIGAPGYVVSILASLQQGVIGINNLTQVMKTIFPSSS